MADATTGRLRAALWPALLVGAGAGGALALSCATPFAGLAALAATRLGRAQAFATLALAWAASQLIGFCVLDYPRDPRTLAWGAAMLAAALAAVAAARWGAGHAPGRAALPTAFGTGFVAYKAALVAWSLVLGGVHTALSPFYTARAFGREALILAGLWLFCRALVALGMPPARANEGAAWA